jgi:hypothetical protein
MTAEQIKTRSEKVRGMARASLELIEAMYAAAEAAQPITGRREAHAESLRHVLDRWVPPS